MPLKSTVTFESSTSTHYQLAEKQLTAGPTINWITIVESEEVLDAKDYLLIFKMNREGLGISSDLSREMPVVHRLVVSCKEKISVRGDPKLWIEQEDRRHLVCGLPTSTTKPSVTLRVG